MYSAGPVLVVNRIMSHSARCHVDSSRKAAALADDERCVVYRRLNNAIHCIWYGLDYSRRRQLAASITRLPGIYWPTASTPFGHFVNGRVRCHPPYFPIHTDLTDI